MRIACYGWVLDGAPSLAGSYSILLAELLNRGHAIDLYVDPSHIPSPTGWDPEKFSYLPVELPGWYRSLPRWTRRFTNSMMSPIVRRAWAERFTSVAMAHHGRLPYDIVLSLGTPPVFTIPGVPTFTWAQAPFRTEAQAIREVRSTIMRASGLQLYLALRGYYAVKAILQRGLLATSDGVACASSWATGALAEEGVPVEKLRILPLPVDLDFFQPSSSTAAIRPAHVVFVGRLDPRKRLDLVLEGFRLLRGRIPDARLTIVGSARYARGQRRWIAREVLAGGVSHIPRVPRSDVPSILRSATVLAQPSMNETFGTAVAEALACGVPVVVGPTNGTRDYISPDSEVAEEYTPAAVCDALARVIARVEEAPGAVQRRAREAAERRLSASVVATELEQALVETMARTCGSAPGVNGRSTRRAKRNPSECELRTNTPRPSAPLAISVVVPSYQRPDDLRLCLASLTQQVREPDEVVVVVRDTDRETHNAAREFDGQLPLRIVTVIAPGLVAALNAGLAVARADVVAFTDDDASPRPDWIQRLEGHYLCDRRVGGVGGRDLVVGNTLRPVDSTRVGRVQWSGRCIGNHALGTGSARYVDVLKGVNMSFTAQALAGLKFDECLRGMGATANCDLAMSLDVRQQGWLLVYDPDLLVEHRARGRAPGDERDPLTRLGTANAAYNQTRIMLRYLKGWRSAVFIAWTFLVGTRGTPGVVQAIRRNGPPLAMIASSMKGKANALAEKKSLGLT